MQEHSNEVLRFFRVFVCKHSSCNTVITPLLRGVLLARHSAARGGVGGAHSGAHGTHSPPEPCWYTQRRPFSGGYGRGLCKEKRSGQRSLFDGNHASVCAPVRDAFVNRFYARVSNLLLTFLSVFTHFKYIITRDCSYRLDFKDRHVWSRIVSRVTGLLFGCQPFV